MKKKLNNHPNILKFIAAACEEKDHSKNEYLVLTELCKGGSLIDYVRLHEMNPEQVLQSFYQICKAVQHLHTQDRPVTHRDLKVENFLISNDAFIKLCDFGSATMEHIEPDNSWSANKRSLAEDEIAKFTTPMYRAPEMLDLYSNYPIGTKSDIWALGCVLYVLCFNKHPYEDSAKLRIVNANYTIPNNKEFGDFTDLIRNFSMILLRLNGFYVFLFIFKGCMFNVDPRDRPDINEVLFHLENISQMKSIPLNTSLKFLLKGAISPQSANNSPPHFNQQQNQSQNQANDKWNFGGATTLLKGSLKTFMDASSKVIDSVQQYFFLI